MSIILLNCVWFKSVLAVLCADCLEKERSIPPTHGVHCLRNMWVVEEVLIHSVRSGKISLVVTSVFQWLVFPIISPIQYVTEGITFECKLICKQILLWSSAMSMISFITKCTCIKSLTWDGLLRFMLVARSEWHSLLLMFVTLRFCCGNYCQLINSAFYDLWESQIERIKTRGCCLNINNFED